MSEQKQQESSTTLNGVDARRTMVGKLPPCVVNIYQFDACNVLSFIIVQSAPMLLYFKKLGVSATVLSIAAALAPLLNTLQIPAANFIERIGYRKFTLKGWTARSFVILFMTAVIAAPSWMDKTTRVCLMFFLLLCYNASRGISAGAILPWFTQLVPEEVRGRFISIEQMVINIFTIVVMMGASFYLNYFHQPRDFAAIFFFSFVAAMVSLFFLNRIPDVKVEHTVRNRQPVPWGAMLRHPPFKKLLIYNFIVYSAVAPSGIFYIPFLRDTYGTSDSTILMLNVIYTGVSVLTLFCFGKILDRVGNKPFLDLSNIILAIHFAAWGCVAGRVLPFNWKTILFLQISAGLGVPLFTMANLRLAMNASPVMGRSHFFALFSVVITLTMGFVPIVWGMIVDSLKKWHFPTQIWNWNIYSVFYIVISLTMLIALMHAQKLKDSPSMTTEMFMKELFLHSPRRALSALLRRVVGI